MDAQLAGPGPEQVSLHPDDVANVEPLVQCKVPLPHAVLANVDLQLLAVLHQMSEPCLTHAPDGRDATRHLDLYPRLQLFRRLAPELGQYPGDGVREIEPLPIGSKP